MAFKRFGSPEPMKILTECEDCKQPRPLLTVKKDGISKRLCGECIKKCLKASNDSAQ